MLGVRPGRGFRCAGERTCRRRRGRRPAWSRVAGSGPGSPRRSSRSPFRDGGTLWGRPSQRLIAKGVHALPSPAVSDGPPLLFSSPQVSGAWELVDGEGKVFNLDVLAGVRPSGRGGRLEIITTSLVFRSEVFAGDALNDKRGRQLESRSQHAFLSNWKRKLPPRRDV